ncbi:hypothetical protein BD289DRAFT_454352 [Coniella lustricola]|uniref:Uncharacterized protein n=1 Tax=Coniella lustricola TaxID=2025994 RepID=A0A2T3A3T9_9PEZI|nr:hypothetical protein BD289DRAFT_454352 [Coniella lustricola]
MAALILPMQCLRTRHDTDCYGDDVFRGNIHQGRPISRRYRHLKIIDDINNPNHNVIFLDDVRHPSSRHYKRQSHIFANHQKHALYLLLALKHLIVLIIVHAIFCQHCS